MYTNGTRLTRIFLSFGETSDSLETTAIYTARTKREPTFPLSLAECRCRPVKVGVALIKHAPIQPAWARVAPWLCVCTHYGTRGIPVRTNLTHTQPMIRMLSSRKGRAFLQRWCLWKFSLRIKFIWMQNALFLRNFQLTSPILLNTLHELIFFRTSYRNTRPVATDLFA